MNPLEFQQIAIEELIEKFKKLWNKNLSDTAQLVFKSPTGSGKTFVTTSFINKLNDQPDWQNNDVAFVWITFSDTLAMQSRDKFREYFSGNLNNQLLTVEDFSNGVLNRNDVLFINWQKLVSKKAENRVLRRPDDERNIKENGYYFEDVLDNTKKQNRQIILIIDESHKNVTESADRDVISKLQPRVMIKVSATPFNNKDDEDGFYSLVGHGSADIVEVKREDVVAEGLIKSKIVCQTEEELLTHKADNLDELMLDLAIERRNEIANEWKRQGKNINPLVLIQLPNDDKDLEEEHVKTKETVVLDYLKEKGISQDKIALWFDDKKENMDFITQNDCEVDFMLFKIAAGTGWDCPRAHVLVMYREIKKAVFQTQTLGRILRMAYVDRTFHNELLTTGYLYTNYKSNEVGVPDQDGKNKPKVFTAEISKETKKILLTQHLVNEFEKKLTDVNNLNGEILADEKKNEIIQKVKGEIEKTITSMPFESDEDNRNKDIHEKSKKVIEQKTTLLVDAIKKIVVEETPVELTENMEKEIKTITNEMAEVAANESEKELVLDPALKSDFLSRTDYGDIGKVSEFQKYFIQFMNEYFGINDKEILLDNSNKLVDKGVSLDKNISQEVMANAVYHSEIVSNKDSAGINVKLDMSPNDVDKNFTWMCYEILGEQTEDDAKIGNRARSWGPFKEALRQWFRKYALLNYTDDMAYRIFLNDVYKPQSLFKQAITYSLKKYKPILNAFIKERIKDEIERVSVPFTIKSHYSYSDEYEIYTPSERSLVKPFYLRKDYKGRDNETKFITYLETAPEIKSWFKNGDVGKEFFGIKYFDNTNDCYNLFYPDWIVLTNNGIIGILDTKSGQTASALDTKNKAEELFRRIEYLNGISANKYIGGIVVQANGQWYINDNKEYSYKSASLEGWKTLSWKASE